MTAETIARPTTAGALAPTPDEMRRVMGQFATGVTVVTGIDEEWIRLDHVDWFSGFFCGDSVALRLADVRKIQFADEMPRWEKGGPGKRSEKEKLFDLNPLARAQIRWKYRHDPKAAEERVREYMRMGATR